MRKVALFVISHRPVTGAFISEAIRTRPPDAIIPLYFACAKEYIPVPRQLKNLELQIDYILPI